MRRSTSLLLCLLLLVGTAAADDKPAGRPSPLTPQQAADAVLEAVRAKDEAALKALAEKDDPDPWLVADELGRRGEHDAAEAFARAAPRPAVEKLPAYVNSRRDKEPDTRRRDLLADVQEKWKRGAWMELFAAFKKTEVPLDSVVTLRIHVLRGRAYRQMGFRKRVAPVYTAVGNAAYEMGWLEQASIACHEAGHAAANAAQWKLALPLLTRALRC